MHFIIYFFTKLYNNHSVGMAQPAFKGWIKENGYEKTYININAILYIQGSSSDYAQMKLVDSKTINSRLNADQLAAKLIQADGPTGMAEVPEYTFYA